MCWYVRVFLKLDEKSFLRSLQISMSALNDISMALTLPPAIWDTPVRILMAVMLAYVKRSSIPLDLVFVCEHIEENS